MITYQDALQKIKNRVNGRNVNNFKTRVPKITFNMIKNGVEIHQFELSVQASEYHYSEPRENCVEYDKVEIGFPNFKFSEDFIIKYAEDVDNPLDTVYGHVPIEELALEIANFCKKFNLGELVMTEQTKTTFEPIVLDRFEYTLPKGEYVVYKESSGFLYKMKHTKKEFDSEKKVLKFIEDMLKERKRYQQLLKTLSVPELNKLFSDVTLLGLTPSQIKEYEIIEQFKYVLEISDDWDTNTKTFDNLDEVKCYVADKVGLNFHYYLDLKDCEGNSVVQGG